MPSTCRGPPLRKETQPGLPLLQRYGAEGSDPNLPFMEYLDDNDMVCLKWGFSDVQRQITLKFIVKTTGWIGFGLSPNGDMTGADLVMGGVDSNRTYFKDYYSATNTMPDVDQVQSYTLVSLTESQGETVMTFTRAFQTCDNQDLQITDKPMNLIYAYGATDEITFHGAQAGTKEINLLNHAPKITVANGNYMSVTVQNLAIPAKDTYYHCKVMQLPPLNTKHHIYQVQPVIEHADLVHHMLFYSCPASVNTAYDGDCNWQNTGHSCTAVMAGWAVGGGVFELPENTGIPVGGADNSAFFMLQIHYNNAYNESGRTDSSGLRLVYTDQLRKYDVGILTTGVLPYNSADYNIPPQAAKFRTYGVCNTSLFSEIIDPVPDLNVFAVMLHTHLAGRAVRVGHFRNGRQIGFLGMEPNYDFNLQHITFLGSIKTIKKGDEIVVECSYNTADRTGVTQMGESTMDEMCLAFLFFYPRISITTCLSQPNSSHLQFPDGLQNQKEIMEYESAVKNLSHIQFAFSNSDFMFYPFGQVRDVKEAPTDPCETSNAANHKYSQASLFLLLAWILLM
nr:DBH-like monooxygenase protein 2 homolog isoform X1 [Nerophis lumbriciformis]